jgi:predicted CXXCH cytochrome family protein
MRIRYAVAAVVALLVRPAPCEAQVASTKHNLSVTGPGTIKAASEQQVCAFCHTPHKASPTAQLWNRSQPATTYTLYSSDFLTSKGYASPAQINAKSKLCMSCHDGTIALGAVINAPAGATNPITMSGGVTTMPAGSAGYLGTVLSDDHPVGFGYDPVRDPELVNRVFPWTSAVKLDPDASNGKVECHTCHNPHDNQYTHFLRMSNSNAALCTWCHNKTGWAASIHDNSTQTYTPPGMPATTIGEWACRDCHKPHSGGGSPYILQSSEQNTCYQTGCHGSTGTGAGTKDLQTVLNKSFAHPTNTVSGRHKNPDTPATLDAANRHAECQDCHDPHQAKDGLHTTGSNLLSNVLAGAGGLIPGTAAIWTQTASYTAVTPAVQENQVCFKCHSSYALGVVAGGVSAITGPSGTKITDQAMEYNPANFSAHPVRFSSNNQTGSVAPKALNSVQMSAPWTAVGTQTMQCSDCHGSDDVVTATAAQGPHGSTMKFMLKGTSAKPNAQYWPTNSGGANVWTLRDLNSNTNSWSTNMFCVGCHPLYSGGTWYNNAHSEHATRNVTIGGKAYTGIPCASCHVAVPHGSKRGRLIAYVSDVAPYAYRDGTINVAFVSGFKKAASRTGYSKSNCYSTQSGCTTHSNAGGYDQ